MSSLLPHTPEDVRAMLAAIGAADTEALFSAIPAHLRARSFDLPPGLSELEVERALRSLARRNAKDLVIFLGGGFYDHFIPAAVDALASRSEFVTPYTPYQPEASQGTLQAAYEFQSCICRLTGMEVANASLYDGGTALFEAAMMAVRITGRNRVLVDGGVNPLYRRMLRCHTANLGLEVVEIAATGGRADREALEAAIGDSTAAVILQNPNFFGVVDHHGDVAECCHAHGALLIESVYPISLGLLASPGEMGADIATGEGQSLGIPLSFGGPYLGFLAARRDYVRRMPGRIAGVAADARGRRGFVLTLQTREQHIRREKATSNICTNNALCALRALVFMCLAGESGLREMAQLCLDKAEYAKTRLAQVRGVVVSSEPTFNEFAVRLPKDPGEVVGKLLERGIAGGLPLGLYYPLMKDWLLVAVTEKRTRQEIDGLAEALEDVLWR